MVSALLAGLFLGIALGGVVGLIAGVWLCDSIRKDIRDLLSKEIPDA